MNRLDAISLGKIVVIREQLLSAQRDGKKIYRFESGDPSFDIPLNVKDAMNKALLENKTHYIPNNGIPELRDALAKKLTNKNKIPTKASDVSITNGAMHALYVAYQCFIHEGDEVIVPDPMWTEAVENIRLAGGVPVPVELLKQENYVYTCAEIEKKLTSKTRAIFINTPHNPTGAIIPKDELEKIAKLAVRKNLWIVSDEAYEDVLYDGGTHTSIAGLIPDYKKVISIYSYSKSYAMSGLRLGYLACQNAEFNERLAKILRCTVNGINSVSQWGAVSAILETSPSWFETMNAEYLKRRDLFLNGLSNQDILKPFKPQSAFYLWCEVKDGIKADELSAKLANVGIGNAPGDCFGVTPTSLRSIRFAFSCSTKMIEEGIGPLNEFLKKL